MIRFLQTDNRIIKALFVVVIWRRLGRHGGLPDPRTWPGQALRAPDTFAVVYPHWYSRILSSGDTISQTHVQQVAENELRQRGPQYANNPMIVQFFEQQVGQQLVQQQVLLQEAHKLGMHATDDDVRQYLRTGPTGAGSLPQRQIHRRRCLQATD